MNHRPSHTPRNPIVELRRVLTKAGVVVVHLSDGSRRRDQGGKPMNGTATHDIELLRANVAESLQARDIFCLYSNEIRGKALKPTKVPKQLNGANAKSNDPRTWSTFNDALAALQLDTAGKFAGLGLIIPPDHVGIDFDKSRDPETGELREWAKPLVSLLTGTYLEVSPVAHRREGARPCHNARCGVQPKTI